jgi:hypothetical protein
MADMYERKPQKLTGPGGDQKELRVKYIDNLDGTWSLAIGAITLPLPDGAATALKQDTTNTKLDDLITAVSTVSPAYKLLLDDTTTANVTYVGKAAIGSATSASVWQIQKIDETSGMVITWGGTGAFDQEWDERAGTVVYA